MDNLSMFLAKKIVDQAIATATSDGGAPICIAVCDKSGFLLAFTRMDGATLRSIRISQCKAYTASRMGVTTTAFAARLQRENIPASYFCDPEFTALPGGTPLVSADGTLLGAVGISGRVAEDDQKLTDAIAVMVKNSQL